MVDAVLPLAREELVLALREALPAEVDGRESGFAPWRVELAFKAHQPCAENWRGAAPIAVMLSVFV